MRGFVYFMGLFWFQRGCRIRAQSLVHLIVKYSMKTVISGLSSKSRLNGRTFPYQAAPGSREDLLSQILRVSNFDYKNHPSIN